MKRNFEKGGAVLAAVLTITAAGCASLGGGGSTIDKVYIGNQVSENAHNLQAENTENGTNIENWRHAIDAGFFQFTLKTGGNANVVLVVRYWAHEGGERSFTISVDDKVIATENVVGKFNNEEVKQEFYDVRYPIPSELVQGKDSIKVKFQGVDEYQIAGGVYGLSLEKAGE